MGCFFKQLYHLVADNRLHAVIVIVGTAVTMTFVMMVVMVYDFRTADIAPESDRSRTLYTALGKISAKDGTNIESGMGRLPFETLFADCPGVEAATWSGYLGTSPCAMTSGGEQTRLFVKDVPVNWFDFFDYTFIAGRPFAEAQYDGPAREAAISQSAARRLSKGDAADMVGREIYVNFRPVRVTGVYDDVSPILQKAYADVLLPFGAEGNARDGLSGRRLGVLKLSPGADRDEVEREIARRESMLNSMCRDNKFHMERLYDQVEYTFFRDEMINANLVYGLLLAVLLLVPAMGLAGLINAQMQTRLGEIAIRKAYGADNIGIMWRLFAENFVETLAGGIIGYIGACVLVWLCRDWIFGEISGDAVITAAMVGRPVIALYVVGASVVFTSVVTLVPAWMAARRNIALTLKGND